MTNQNERGLPANSLLRSNSDEIATFSEPQAETNATYKTVAISNNDFLEGIFGKDTGTCRPIIASFACSPSDKYAKWKGVSWSGSNADNLSPNNNNYFSISAYHPDENGAYSRHKKQFSGLYAIMLDDVGTKIPEDRIKLLPTWRIETSPLNFQLGFVLNNPITDSKLADKLMNAVVEAELCDPGANGPTARYARLPVAENRKYEPAFSVKLVEWEPDRRYTVEDLEKGLGLEFISKNKAKQSTPAPSYEDAVFTPRPEQNIVLAALHDRGWLKAKLDGDKHDITCPWVGEHTGAIDSGTAYFEPSAQFPIGGFKCMHGHCAHRKIRDLLDYLGIEGYAAQMTPVIRVTGGEIHRVVEAAEQELARTGRFYQRGGSIVTLSADPGTGESKIIDMSPSSLVPILSSEIRWEKMDGRSGEVAPIDPPARHLAVLHDAKTYKHLPVLSGLSRQPYLRSDYTLATIPNYDASTGIYGIFNADDFQIPASPTRQQAEKALESLSDMLKEFAFAEKSDFAAALAAILTATIRPSLKAAPMFHVKAHQPASGKSYLCSLINAFATPKRGTPSSFPAQEEECRKFLLAELLRGPAAIEFDNLTSEIVAHKSLCTALTSEFITDRVLGMSKTATVSTRTLFLSSGNNVGPVSDMTRRCVTINIDPACETPATRTFTRPKLVDEVLQQRGVYVSMALTIVQAWLVAGRPLTLCRALAGYGEWSDLCRQPLLWLGTCDPIDSVFKAMEDDPEREQLGALLKAWHDIFENRPTMIRNVVERANDTFGQSTSELKEAIMDIAGEKGEINRKRLGWWIKHHAGHIVNGLRFRPSSGKKSAVAWHVEKVS